MLIRLLTIVIIGISVLSGLEYGSISTSRPGAANPTSAVPANLYQFEMGINSDINDNLTYPFLFRTGVLSSTEIQIGYGGNFSLSMLYGGIHLVDMLSKLNLS